MSEIRVGDLVANIKHPELDYRRVMAIGGGFLTLNIGGTESKLLPANLYKKVESPFERKGFHLVTINDPMSVEDVARFCHFVENMTSTTLAEMKTKIIENEPVRFFMDKTGDFYLSENGRI